MAATILYSYMPYHTLVYYIIAICSYDSVVTTSTHSFSIRYGLDAMESSCRLLRKRLLQSSESKQANSTVTSNSIARISFYFPDEYCTKFDLLCVCLLVQTDCFSKYSFKEWKFKSEAFDTFTERVGLQ